ncbi:MAG TPA: LysR substrate-binding domain-containing protein [Burkholderiales bacterium]|jgi:DNA-binding transcriptional LysR family regulator|nr:LysR substrate-binding domain-containing protein [Burkholderiales bacterium]
MRLQRIEQFIAVAEAGSIRGAARTLAMSQPALTRALQQLEAELGVQLMQRGVRGILLTPAGSAFLARARVASSEIGKAFDEARRSNENASGLVTCGLSPVAASLLLPEMAVKLQAQRAGARLRVMEMPPSALLPQVRDGAVELAVTQRTRAGLDAGLRYRPLFEIQLRVAARRGHPLAGMRELAELAGAQWLAQTAPGIPDDITTQSFLAIGLPAPLPAVHWGSFMPSVFDLVAASDMLITLTPPLLRSLVAAGKLIEIPLTQPLVPLRVGLYNRSDSQPTANARATAQIITAIARRYAASGELRDTTPLAAPAERRRSARGR